MINYEILAGNILKEINKDYILRLELVDNELTLSVNSRFKLEEFNKLKNLEFFSFKVLMDVCGVDYSEYGKTTWNSNKASNTSFSRAVGNYIDNSSGLNSLFKQYRFAVVYHFLSLEHNHRLRLKIFSNDDPPSFQSVTSIWSSANWYERETYDMYGILFAGHPDLRRILTDYTFKDFPLRKDYPIGGKEEVYYNESLGEVVYRDTVDPEQYYAQIPKIIRPVEFKKELSERINKVFYVNPSNA